MALSEEEREARRAEAKAAYEAATTDEERAALKE